MDAINDPLVASVSMMSSAQVGKALDVDTPIPTPGGWSCMGDLEPGDTVFNEHGEAVSVVGVSEVMRGHKCYDVHFSDGSVICADAEHLWSVDDVLSGECVVSTDFIFDNFKIGNRNRFAVDVAWPLEMPNAKLPLDPYFLGVWLGDGHSYSATISCGAEDVEWLSGELREIYPEFRVEPDGSAYSIKYRRNEMKCCIRGHDPAEAGTTKGGYCAECSRQYAMKHKRGHAVDPVVNPTMQSRLAGLCLLKNKHIPSAYMRASVGQRQALLCGLMDTDGWIVEGSGRSGFVTTAPALADGFGELLASLGIKYTVRDTIPKTTYKGKVVHGAPGRRFDFMVYSGFPVFRNPRKLSRMVSSGGRGPNGGKRRTSETWRRRIVNVELVETRPVRCIAVDSPANLYLAGRTMIPTHNTEILLNGQAYYSEQDPSPQLAIQPTIEMGEAYSKDRLAPMIAACPVLAARFGDPSSRKTGNNLRHKKFPGGHLTIAGANSPASLASRPVRIIWGDEVDRWPASAGAEGDPVDLARKRTATFHNRKLVWVSTPTIKDVSRIERLFMDGDQRRYHVPCPHCGELQVLKFGNLKWEKGAEDRPWFECSGCSEKITEEHKTRMLAMGEWVAAEPFRGHASFHIWEAYSPWRKWGEIVGDFLKAKRAPDTLRVWTNTCLGEPFEDLVSNVEVQSPASRCEVYGAEVPDGVLAITCGVDVQDDRLEAVVYGWGVDEESWCLDRVVIGGVTTAAKVWADLDKLLFGRAFVKADGSTMRIVATGIDSGGHRTQQVYKYAQKWSAKRVYALKGMGGAGRPIIMAPSKKTTADSRTPVRLHTVGTDEAKSLIYARLMIQDAGPGYMHFPATDVFDQGFFDQLTAEKCVTRYKAGVPRREWIKVRTRNEVLDCTVYALAAMHALRPNWATLMRRASTASVSSDSNDSGGKRAARRRKPNSFAGSWRK